MLKPTESPPPSCAPRFAASITPGPPPVITAQPRPANRRPTARAAAYAGLPSTTLAEPNTETAGRSMRATCAKPARNSSAIVSTACAGSASAVSRRRRSSTALEPVLWHVRLEGAVEEQDRRRRVQEPRDERQVATAPVPEEPRRAPDRAAVEGAERQQVEQVEHEPEVRERDQQVGSVCVPDHEAGERPNAAEDRAGDRDAGGLPRVPARVLDVRAEERDEDRPRRLEPFAARLEEVPHLVNDDQHDHSEGELPPPDQCIAAERDEDRPELGERAELDEDPEDRDERRRELLEHPAPVGAARLN